MSYVDARLYGNKVYVSERTQGGRRRIKKYDAPAYCFVEDDEGDYKSLFGDPLSKLQFENYQDMKAWLREIEDEDILLYESDISPHLKILEEKYLNKPLPTLHVSILDIEVDSRIEKGWARYNNPYAPINAVTVRRCWLKESVTIALCPETLTMEQAEAAVAHMENTYIVETEEELLILLIELLEDSDVTSGWNSKFFDMPYIIARIRIVLGGESEDDVADVDLEPSLESKKWLKKLCLFDKIPNLRFEENYGSLEVYFDFPGVPHLDYLELYRKFTQNELATYKLDFVLRTEVNQTKVPFEGSLEQLYKNQFGLFCEYNRQDTDGLAAIDDKLGYIALANVMAHNACVLLPATLKSVGIIEQAITVECHQRDGSKVPDKNSNNRGESVAGATVFLPKGGLEEWIMSVDLTSLYPSIIRLLNIGPDSVIGQLDTSRTEAKIKNLIESGVAKTRTEAWHHFTGVLEYHDVVEGNEDELLTMVMEDGERLTQSGAEWKEFFEDAEDLCISANGTVFDTSKDSIISYCLSKWFAERVEYKGKMKEMKKAGKDEEADYWDRIQNARKLFLNSTYGALLNNYFRFYDPRFGQSTTLSGRIITKHMARKSNELLGYDYSFEGALIGGDTDSNYLRLGKKIKERGLSDDDVDEIVKLADEIGEQVNASFPDIASTAFFVTGDRRNVIEAKREVVARRGLFKDKKKRYALYVINDEGIAVDKLKIIGLDIVRSETPDYIQDFLTECVKMLVQENRSEQDIMSFIEDFRHQFRERDPWTVGKSMRVSNLTAGAQKRKLFEEGKIPNPRVSFNVIAADNTNKYIEYFNEKRLDRIYDGEKIQIIDLKKDPKRNPLGFSYIAIPVGADYYPDWFKKLPFDIISMEEKLVTQKLKNTFDVMGWDLETKDSTAEDIFF